ncbi:MAG: dTDP-4-dehydrorhamnose reductase [Acetobacteraceae bacterium]|nr:dTDP-4-dehydrorhamnose reductase [Acetobacteraceae bacterium]
MTAPRSAGILVTGGSGQVARALGEAAGDRALRVVGRPDWDFDRIAALPALLAEARPALVVNAAAHTAVDRAETDAAAAWRANRDGPAVLAAYCGAAGVPLIHISTDFVFDGAKGAPYAEDDATSPASVYGASKLAGEAAVLAACPRAIILRTSWVYAASGRNFVLTMLDLARTRSHLRVVADQRGCPTTAEDLAAAILAIADVILRDGWQDRFAGIYHAAGSGCTTWHGLASAAIARAHAFGQPQPAIAPITTAEYPTPARRPADSRLDCTKLERIFGLRLPPWEQALDRTIARIFAGETPTP